MAKKNPSTLLYWNDLDDDVGLKLCSLAAQGLWLRMLCIASRSDPQGYIAVEGVPCTGADLAKIVGEEVGKIVPLLEELGSRKVYSVTTKGTMYNRRMVRDSLQSETNRKSGRIGGLASARNQKGIFSPLRNNTERPTERPPERAVERPSELFYTSYLESNPVVSEFPTPRAREPDSPQRAKARATTTRFLELRKELWPHEGDERLVMLTLWTEAEAYLGQMPKPEVDRIVERVMRKLAADGKSAPRSLGFCRLSIQDAAAGQRTAEAALQPGDALVRALEGNALRDQVRRKGYAERGTWFAEWGPPPADIAPPAKAKRRAAAAPVPDFPS